MQKIFSNIPFLICLVLLCWILGLIWPLFGVNSEFALNTVRMSAGVPIAFLSMRKTIRLGWMEVIERQADISDLNSSWTSDGGWDKEMQRNNRLFEEQYKDHRAQVLFVWFLCLELVYFISVSFLDKYLYAV